MTSAPRTLRLAVLFSGGGRTVLNLMDRIDDASLPATIVSAIASRDCAGIKRIESRGVDVRLAADDQFANDDLLHATITHWLREADVDLICLCGYLRWFQVNPHDRHRVINIHPALLPAFGGKGMYGMRVHRAVLDAGAVETGCTVHFVDDIYDHGPTILQRRCPVLPDDDPQAIADRVFELECTTYPDAIRLFAEDRIRVEGGVVRIVDENVPKTS
ncbi:MAG: phosphoribosylglycinamide formyltransferase [Planctomycetota bacterium]